MDSLVERSKKIAKRVYKKEGLSVPVDIRKLIEKYADLEEVELPFAGDAICINKEDRPLIIYDSNSTETRLRFTLAHELGHIKIPWHTGLISCHIDENQEINSNEYENMEEEANVFASELLMPRDWLVGLVKKYEKEGLEQLVKHICEVANVSFLAALYAVVKVLPKGYIIFIDRKKEMYTQAFTSNNTEILRLYEQGLKFFKWLEANAVKFESIKRDNEDIFCFKLEGTLDENTISNLLFDKDNKNNLTKVLDVIFTNENESPAVILPILMKVLPPGYIIRVELTGTNVYLYTKSDNTFIKARLDLNNEADLIAWYNNYSIYNGVYRNKKFTFNWWQFEISNQMNYYITDHRESKTILKDIIDRNYYGSNRKSILGKINGTVGALNNKKNEIDSSEFYSILRQKFLGREDLEDIINDEDFDKFLSKKTQELYNI